MKDETDKKIEEFIRAIERTQSTPRVLFRSFLIGLFGALGASVGLSIFLALLTVILDWLGIGNALKPYLESVQK